jgi:hypothetical protein
VAAVATDEAQLAELHAQIDAAFQTAKEIGDAVNPPPVVVPEPPAPVDPVPADTSGDPAASTDPVPVPTSDGGSDSTAGSDGSSGEVAVDPAAADPAA